MKVSIHAIGRMKAGPERDLVARYLDRAQAGGKALGLTGFAVLEFAESRAGTVAARKADEARLLCDSLPAGARRVVLDEHGQHLGSEELARLIGRWRDGGTGALGFVIGGPDGLDPPLMAQADLLLSFSALTWPHQIVRILLAEQLYRMTTILSGHPYHRA